MRKGILILMGLLFFSGVCFAADTITVLDGLTNNQTAADSDFYTIDTVNVSAVSQHVVAIPQTANRVRVVYNNTYDADGSTVYIRCRLSKTTAVGTLAKSVAEVDAFQEIAQNTILEGATVDVSGLYDVTLYIDCALSSTTAHTGTEIIVQVSSATSGDNMWENLTSFTGVTGTAIKIDLGGDENAGQTVLTVTNPVTSNLDILGKIVFLENTATAANSELVYQTAQSGD